MTRRRWIADEASDNSAALTGSHAEHLVRVLRARVGEEFDIVANGVLRRGRISSVTDDRVNFSLGEEIQSTPTANVTLLLAIFKFDRMEWAIEKCTELGVSKIVPVIARRTDAHLASAASKRAERWRRIALQASEQSRRTSPPEIAEPAKLASIVVSTAPIRIVLAETEQQIQLRDVLAGHSASEEIFIAIGPEGGWTEDELQSFSKNGWSSASLGNTILRAETAAIAAMAVTMAELGSSS